jgi:hypothetical protein
VGKVGKRRKIHNFPTTAEPARSSSMEEQSENWRRRLSALIAVTGRSESDLLEESVRLLAMKILRDKDRSS